MADTQKKIKLLVVDDETYNLDLLYRTFRREFQVYKAESGPSALQILDEKGEMGIIISDQRMPEMNGTEFLSKTVDRFPDTIRILLTGYTDVEDLVEAINSGQVFKYITKPWNPEELKSIVNQAADTYRVLKQRTNTLQRSLRRESLLNAIVSAIRESLDYDSMLQTIVETVGQNFHATSCFLQPVEGDRLVGASFAYPVAHNEPPAEDDTNAAIPKSPLVQQALETLQTQATTTNDSNGETTHLVVPLTYQKQLLAVLSLNQSGGGWEPEDIQLIEGVADQAAIGLYQAKLYQQTLQLAERMRSELEVARQIQNNLLRQSWPETENASVQACCHAARQVGGDFFEVYVNIQGQIWLAVGDVSGKGVPAALFMASAISVMRRELAQETSLEPEVLMKSLNSSLSDDLVSNNCFITMVLARYTPTTGILDFANAGHIYPMVWSHRTVVEQFARGGAAAVVVEPAYLKDRGVPLGILPEWRGKAGSVKLSSGDVFLLMSDGITEATVTSTITNEGERGGESKSGLMLGDAGLWQLLIAEPTPLNLDRLLSRIRELAQQQEDDQTILSLEVQ